MESLTKDKKCTTWNFPQVGNDSLRNLSPSEIQAQEQKKKNALLQVRKEAEAEGKKTGIEEGRKIGFLEFDGKIKQVNDLFNGFDKAVAGLTDVFAKEITELAFELAKYIIQHEVSTSSETIQLLIKEVMSCIPKQAKDINVYVNQKDLDFMKELKKDYVIDNIDKINFIVDEKISQGGFILKSDNSYADVTVEKRLADILSQAKNNNN